MLVKRNPVKRKTKMQRLRAAALKAMGGVCVRCGFTDPRALQIDHIYGGGVKHTKVVPAIVRYEAIIAGDIGPLQLLCANCNWIKRCENDENSGSRKQQDMRMSLVNTPIGEELQLWMHRQLLRMAKKKRQPGALQNSQDVKSELEKV